MYKYLCLLRKIYTIQQEGKAYHLWQTKTDIKGQSLKELPLRTIRYIQPFSIQQRNGTKSNSIYLLQFNFLGLTAELSTARQSHILVLISSDQEKASFEQAFELRRRKTPRILQQNVLEYLEEQSSRTIAKRSKICRFDQGPAQGTRPFPLEPGIRISVS